MDGGRIYPGVNVLPVEQDSSILTVAGKQVSKVLLV